MDISSILSMLQGDTNAQNPLLMLLPLLMGGQQAQGANQKGKDMLLPLLSSLLSGNAPDMGNLFGTPREAKPLPQTPLQPIAHIADHEILYSLQRYLAPPEN